MLDGTSGRRVILGRRIDERGTEDLGEPREARVEVRIAIGEDARLTRTGARCEVMEGTRISHLAVAGVEGIDNCHAAVHHGGDGREPQRVELQVVCKVDIELSGPIRGVLLGLGVCSRERDRTTPVLRWANWVIGDDLSLSQLLPARLTSVAELRHPAGYNTVDAAIVVMSSLQKAEEAVHATR